MTGNSMNKLFFICLGLSIIGVSACKSRKNKIQPVIVPAQDSAIKTVTAEDLLQFTLKDWTYFSSKIDVAYKNGDNEINADVHIRMLKDSLVWIRASIIVEGARILINKDSIVILDRLHKKYTVYHNQAIAGFSDVPLTVSQVQNLILAKPVYALKLYDILVNSDSRLDINYTQEKFTTSHHYGKQFYTIDTTMIKDRTTRNYAMARYQDYSLVNGHNFPLSTFVTASNGDKLINLELKFKDTDFETPLAFPFEIPSSYEKAP